MKVIAMEPIGSAFNSGVQGIQSGFDALKQDADQIAKANKPDQAMDFAKPMVNLVADRTQIEASVKAVQATDAMTKTIGSLLDVKA